MLEAWNGWGERAQDQRTSGQLMVALGAILVMLVSHGGPGRDATFRRTSLSRSNGEWIEERARKEAGQINKETKESMAIIQVTD